MHFEVFLIFRDQQHISWENLDTSLFSPCLLAIISYRSEGIYAYLPVIEAFVLIPSLELIFAPRPENLGSDQKEMLKSDAFFIWALRATIPVQLLCGVAMLQSIHSELDTITLVGRILSYGIMCGVVGINVAHELGHKTNKLDQFLAKVLLTSTLYTHFFLEHNFGHHKNVGTPGIPPLQERENGYTSATLYRI